MLIDTHTHVNFNSFKDDYQQVIQQALNQEIWLINVGSQYTTSARAVKLAQAYPEGVYAAIGLHPIHLFELQIDLEEGSFTSRQERFDQAKYQALINQDQQHKIVAIGEIGLDYYHLPADHSFKEVKQLQSEQFIKQLKFAINNNLPVILHCRGSQQDPFGAYDDLYQIIADLIKNKKQPLTGVVHCYGGSLEQAKKFIELGFYIGFTGIITFGKNAEPLRQIAEQLPLEKILVETDAPYLSPVPYRGQRNQPAYVEYVAKKLAEIKRLPFPYVAEQTTRNAKQLFKI